MRDPKRIDKCLNTLREVWYEFPDWRFMQLICNFQSWIGTDGFFLEDEDFQKKLSEYLNRLQKTRRIRYEN